MTDKNSPVILLIGLSDVVDSLDAYIIVAASWATQLPEHRFADSLNTDILNFVAEMTMKLSYYQQFTAGDETLIANFDAFLRHAQAEVTDFAEQYSTFETLVDDMLDRCNDEKDRGDEQNTEERNSLCFI